MDEKKYPKLILGLDISTVCIGIAIIYDDGINEPQIELISHVSPKIDKKIKGIEALILRKNIFENDFLVKLDDTLSKMKCPLKKITDVVIEAPLKYSSGGSNAETVATLLMLNGILSDSVYRTLHLVPNYVSSSDARMRSFPDLLSIRKFNMKGEIYPLPHFKKALKENALVLFGSYPFDCDKKLIMMNRVSEKYPNIPWIYDKKGSLKKENYDSCDALVCALAYSNEQRYGTLNKDDAKITFSSIEKDGVSTVIEYTMHVWGREYNKKIVITENTVPQQLTEETTNEIAAAPPDETSVTP